MKTPKAIFDDFAVGRADQTERARKADQLLEARKDIDTLISTLRKVLEFADVRAAEVEELMPDWAYDKLRVEVGDHD